MAGKHIDLVSNFRRCGLRTLILFSYFALDSASSETAKRLTVSPLPGRTQDSFSVVQR